MSITNVNRKLSKVKTETLTAAHAILTVTWQIYPNDQQQRPLKNDKEANVSILEK
jgi:hypothetical protein